MIEFYLWSVLVLFIIMFIVEARSEDDFADMSFEAIILIPFFWPAMIAILLVVVAIGAPLWLLWKIARVGL